MESHHDSARWRSRLYALLGDLPPRHRPIMVTLAQRSETAYGTLETLSLDLNGEEPVPAYFLRPNGPAGARPTILYNHAHGGQYDIGKSELIRPREGLQEPPYGETLAKRGYNVLCIDAWGFGERRTRSESELFKEMLWRGQVLWGMMVYDSIRAIDYLATRPDVDAAHIGTLGMSMGSTMAWWLAAIDPRINVCVDLCCLTDYDALIAARGLDRHGLYYYVPGLLKHFSAGPINALIAPRAHLSLAGEEDPLTPRPGLDRIDRHLQEVYRAHNAEDAWKLLRWPTGHIETPEMRAEALRFFDKWL